MKTFFKYLGISSILLFSFYYTEKVSNIVINNSSLISQINENIDEYNIKAVNAEIDGDYIIPGINGSIVNVLKSYNNMKMLNVFNSFYLVYDKVIPDVSLENNKNKIIKNGNKIRKSVSIIVKDNQEIIDYSISKNISISRLITLDTYEKNAKYEQINNDNINYEKVEKLLNRNNINKNICYINDSLIDICKSKDKYLVETEKVLNNYNLSQIKEIIESGDIFYINDNVSLIDYKIFLRQIYYQDLEIIYLSKLITEEIG